MRLLLLSAALLAGCDPTATGDPAKVTANQIERLSTPPALVRADPRASARVQPLSGDDVAAAPAGPGCRFARGDEVLFVTAGEGAIARIGGELRHLVATAPAGPSGGYFEDRQISVSIGQASAASGPAPARIVVANRRTAVRAELRGSWTCAGVGLPQTVP